MLEFNVPGGKLNRGMAVLDVLKAIKGSEVCFIQVNDLTCPHKICCIYTGNKP